MPKHKLTRFAGTIKYVSLSPHGDPEAIVLEDGSFVKAPPHSLAAKEQLRVGTEVTGEGELIGELPHRVLHHARILAGNTVLADDSLDPRARERRKEEHHAERRARPANPDETCTVAGRIVAIGTKPKGEIDRFILEDGTSVHLPKDLAEKIGACALGLHVEVTGKARRYEAGRFLKAEMVARA